MPVPNWIVFASFWVSVVVAAVAIGSVVVNYLLFRATVDPNVVVYADSDNHRPSIILLIVQNIGRGVAKNITFEFSKPIPERAFGFLPNPKEPQTMRSGPLVEGIPSLGPGAKRVITWGQFGGLIHGLGAGTVVEVTASYTSEGRGVFQEREHRTTSLLEVESFADTDASAGPLRKIADELAKITEEIHAFRS